MNSFELNERAVQLTDTMTHYALAKDYLIVCEELDLAIQVIEASGINFNEAIEAFKDE